MEDNYYLASFKAEGFQARVLMLLETSGRVLC